MDIQALTSSIGAYATATPLANSGQTLQQVAQGTLLQAAEQRQAQASERQVEAPQPVINTLGQKTGTLINATA